MLKQTLVMGALLVGFQTVNANTSLPLLSANQTLTIPSDVQIKLIGVHLQDAVNNFPKAIPGLPNINAFIKKNPEAFFTNGKIDKIHNIHVAKVPTVENGLTKLDLTAFVKYKNQSRFEKLQVIYSNNARELKDITASIKESIALSETDLSIRVALVDRKVIIEDKINDIKFVMPTGVGGFDEGIMNEGRPSLLTPRFKSGYIDKNSVISKRDKPRYFANKPFIRLTRSVDESAEATPIGFHTEINGSFVRGFDSHGCMRLRDQDLFMLHDLIMDGTRRKTPITIAYRVDDEMDHPTGKRDKMYKAVQNVGTAESPFFPLDRDSLVQLVYKSKEVPTDLLQDEPNDDYEDIYSYDTILQNREQIARRKTECSEDFDPKEEKKDFENCVNKGKRKSSAKDALYKWWVH